MQTQNAGLRLEQAVHPLASVVALGSGTAVLVLSEFLPAGVLPTMAADVGVTEGVAGLAVAVTAIAGAVTAPSIAAVLPRTDRRRVLVALLITGAFANLTVAIAQSFGVLLAARLLLGIALAGFWSFAFVAGIQAAPGRARVVSTALSLGVSAATILGVPAAAVIANEIGWRAAFAGAALVCALSAFAVAAYVPSVPAHPAAGLRMMRKAVAHGRLMAGMGCVGLAAFGNFAAYPYIRIVIDRLEFSGDSWLLLAWGVGGLAGNLLAGAFATQLRVIAAVAPLLLGVSLVASATASSVAMLAVSIVAWGLAFNMVPVATQLWVARVEPDHTESAMSLQVTAFQVAITVGAAAGGALLDAHGVALPLLVGAGAAVAAGVGFALLRLPRA